MSSLAVALQDVAAPPLPRSRWPVYADDEIAAVAEVLRSGRVNALHHGDQCRAFEAAYANACRQPHAVAMANGTVTLEVALRTLGIGAGDEVVVTPRSFVASASCVVAVGATPVFADVDPVSQNLTAASIAAVTGPRTRAVIVVHLAGWPCETSEIVTLAEAKGLRVIEDCAQAHGATVGGHPVGSFGDAASFSFCTDKIISTGGEGGMLVLRDSKAFERAWSFKTMASSLAAPRLRAPASAGCTKVFGSNLRMTELQAAIGRRQLAKLPGWTAARRANAAALAAQLDGLEALRLTPAPDHVGHAYYKYYAFIRPERLRWDWSRDRIIAAAQDEGLPCQAGSCPEIYREQAFVRAGLAPPLPLPVAAELGRTSLMLPVDQTMSEADVGVIGARLAAIVTAATA